MEILKKSGSFWKAPCAVRIPEYTVERWVKECIEDLKREPTQERAWIRSGNTIVEVSRKGKGCYQAYIHRDYEIWEVKG